MSLLLTILALIGLITVIGCAVIVVLIWMGMRDERKD